MTLGALVSRASERKTGPRRRCGVRLLARGARVHDGNLPPEPVQGGGKE
jgi:hypothetical protein